MKKNEPQQTPFITSVVRALAAAINSLFFSDNKREFERLKNFIAS